MLTRATLAFLALLLSSDAFGITLVPIPLTSVAQSLAVTASSTAEVKTVTGMDPTDAVANWTISTGSGTSESKVANGILQLSNQGSANGATTLDVGGRPTIEFSVPNFGGATTSILFTLTQVSSDLAGFSSNGQVIQSLQSDGQGGSYHSSILNSTVLLSSGGLLLINGGATAMVQDFLPGDTVTLPLVSGVTYFPSSVSGSYSETFTFQAFALEPIPEPSASALLGIGLVALGLRSRRSKI
jgi:hypothetical protein